MPLFKADFKVTASPKGDKLHIADNSLYIGNDEGYVSADFTSVVKLKDASGNVLDTKIPVAGIATFDVTDKWVYVEQTLTHSSILVPPYILLKGVPLYGQLNYNLSLLVERKNDTIPEYTAKFHSQDVIDLLMELLTAAKYYGRTSNKTEFNKLIAVSKELYV